MSNVCLSQFLYIVITWFLQDRETWYYRVWLAVSYEKVPGQLNSYGTQILCQYLPRMLIYSVRVFKIIFTALITNCVLFIRDMFLQHWLLIVYCLSGTCFLLSCFCAAVLLHLCIPINAPHPCLFSCMNHGYEIFRIRYPGFLHYYHSRKGLWDSKQ